MRRPSGRRVSPASCRRAGALIAAPCTPGEPLTVPSTDLFITKYSFITIDSRVATGARSRAHRHNGEEAVQVEIGSGTQAASRGPTWRIATPRY